MRTRTLACSAAAAAVVFLAGCASPATSGTSTGTTATGTTATGMTATGTTATGMTATGISTESASGSSGASTGHSDTGSTIADPTGTYVSSSVTGHQLVTGTSIRLQIGGGRLSASAGCNTIGGPVVLSGGVLKLTDAATTEIGCPSALSTQDSWLAAFLAAGPAYSLEAGTLTLTGPAVRIVLSPPKAVALEGTTWLLTTLIDRETASSAPAEARAWMKVGDGQLYYADGCDGSTFTATVTATRLQTGESWVVSSGECRYPAVRLAMREVIGGSPSYRIDGDQLTVTESDGARGLAFTAGPNVAGTPPVLPQPAGNTEATTTTTVAASTGTAPPSGAGDTATGGVPAGGEPLTSVAIHHPIVPTLVGSATASPGG